MEQILINYTPNENGFMLSIITPDKVKFFDTENETTTEIKSLLNQIKNLL